MFDSQLLVGKGSNYSVYSPWFPREGNNVTATLEVTAINGATLTVDLWTKNSDETGDGATAATGSPTPEIELTAVGIGSDTWHSSKLGSTAKNANIKELVRYKFTFSGASGEWVAFRMLAPVWFDDVDAAT